MVKANVILAYSRSLDGKIATIQLSTIFEAAQGTPFSRNLLICLSELMGKGCDWLCVEHSTLKKKKNYNFGHCVIILCCQAPSLCISSCILIHPAQPSTSRRFKSCVLGELIPKGLCALPSTSPKDDVAHLGGLPHSGSFPRYFIFYIFLSKIFSLTIRCSHSHHLDVSRRFPCT